MRNSDGSLYPDREHPMGHFVDGAGFVTVVVLMFEWFSRVDPAVAASGAFMVALTGWIAVHMG